VKVPYRVADWPGPTQRNLVSTTAGCPGKPSPKKTVISCSLPRQTHSFGLPVVRDPPGRRSQDAARVGAAETLLFAAAMG
jgi:hypothetical protein